MSRREDLSSGGEDRCRETHREKHPSQNYRHDRQHEGGEHEILFVLAEEAASIAQEAQLVFRCHHPDNVSFSDDVIMYLLDSLLL